MRFRGTVVLVTGASSGIGAAIARRFAQDGARVILAARRTDKLEAFARELQPVGAGVHVLPLDVGDRDAVVRAIDTLPAQFAEVDVLVNNAGGALGLEPAHEASLDDWDAMVASNVQGTLYVTRAVLPGMASRDRGHVVNIGSVAGTYPYPGGNVYGACKAFAAQLSLNLRADLLGKRIRVTSIEPGMVEGTEFSLVRFKGDSARASAVYQGMAALTPDDIADAVHYCVSAPEHVNVNRIEIMPTMQAFGGFAFKRGT
jgi:NADP-dependent 3-hydroxy acid dehydrogenase YdfG